MINKNKFKKKKNKEWNHLLKSLKDLKNFYHTLEDPILQIYYFKLEDIRNLK